MAGTCGYGEELSGPINAGNFLTSGKVYWLASQEGLCSMEYIYIYIYIYNVVFYQVSETNIQNFSVF